MTDTLPEHVERRRGKLVFFLLSGGVGLVLLIVGWYQMFEFLESTTFCGEICHKEMKPQYLTYEVSPHAETDCQGCHVGHGGGNFVKSKLNGVLELVALITNTYERPIRAPFDHLLPSTDTCQQCHWSEEFSGDVLRTYPSYLPDEQNTEQIETMIFRVGTGDQEIASDIHWHIATEVWYLPVDDERREIAWVGIWDEEVGYYEYINPEFKGYSLEELEEKLGQEKRKMDCMDCHNRIGHEIRSPEELIDMALYQGKIDKSLPFIKFLGLQALDPPNPGLEQAFDKIEAIKDFYKDYYPQTYYGNEEAIDRAIEELKEIARLTTFPDMEVTWETYIDDSVCGRPESQLPVPAGCFRCHGKLVAYGWLAETHGEQTINDDCNLCHYSISTNGQEELTTK
jgi:nitrate/TMAO reductase-like tetraheme cytochrome c subunit